MDQALSIALKEWDVVCAALLERRQAILLRKGGILESAGEFELEHQRFLFFPTFIHQDPQGIKPAQRGNVGTVRAEPTRVRLRGWGEVAKIVVVPGRAQMDRLDDLHLWDKPLIDMRFNYRPDRPLYLVVVRAWRLPVEIEIENTLEYAGCKSWVPLERSVETAGSVAAMSPEEVAGIVERIERTFAG